MDERFMRTLATLVLKAMIPDLSGLVLVLFRFGWLAKREPFESISITLAQLTCDSKNQSTIRKQTSCHAAWTLHRPACSDEGPFIGNQAFLSFFFFKVEIPHLFELIFAVEISTSRARYETIGETHQVSLIFV